MQIIMKKRVSNIKLYGNVYGGTHTKNIIVIYEIKC